MYFEKGEPEMRLTLKKVEQAKEAVKKGREAEKLVKTWNDAVKQIGDTGNLRVVAMTIEDGKILPECELDETAGKPILKAAK